MTILSYLIAGGAMISALVVIHEFGHFLVARWFGVGTPVFSVGMGPRIWGFTWKDTDFRLSALPVGGYVQMAGADPFGEEDADGWVDPAQDFMKRPVWQRLLIMLAGPAMNIALPFVVFTGVLMAGDPQFDNVVGRVVEGTPAAAAGLRIGDKVVQVNGEPVEIWADVVAALDEPGEPVSMVLERDGARYTFEVPAGVLTLDVDGVAELKSLGLSHFPHSARVGVLAGSPAWEAGLRHGDAIVAVDGHPVDTLFEARAALESAGAHQVSYRRAQGTQVVDGTVTLPLQAGEAVGIESLELTIGTVVADSAAAEAGMATGDRIVAIDGVTMLSWQHVVDAVNLSGEGVGEGGEPRVLQVDLRRDGKPLRVEVRPKITRQLVMGEPITRPVVGLKQFPDTYAYGDKLVKYYGPGEAFGRAVDETRLLLRGMSRMLGNMGTGRLKVTEGLGGPVAIVQAAGIAAEGGLFEFAKMMGRISLGIGILNLLPVPVLDGGQILFYLIEGLRGRPLPLVLRERILMVGVLMVAALILVVTVSDVGRVIGSVQGG